MIAILAIFYKTITINFARLYSKFKFIKDAIRTNYYSGDSPDDAVLMSLDI